MEAVMDDKAIKAIAAMLMDLQDQENIALPLYEKQLKEAETAIENLLNAIQMGILTPSTKAHLEELEQTKEDLETKIACEKMAKPRITEEQMTFWLHRFRKPDVEKPEHQKMLIDTFVNAIYLYYDKILLTFNFKDGTETVTLDEARAAEEKENMGSDMICDGVPERLKSRDFRCFCFLPCKSQIFSKKYAKRACFFRRSMQ